ncbi:hypothetical protein DMB90_08430 [Raoultella planticola]|uniref:Uncharacterized protein n=1 Tax=Raoultella planticola TaxID=575 RepID=A0A5P6A9R4_RAOPL|nr:hypothetical protein DMB90_08430 [Raoultella planticola]
MPCCGKWRVRPSYSAAPGPTFNCASYYAIGALRKLLLHAIGHTLGEAAIGYLIGMAMAIMLVAATLFIPILWKSVNQLAVFANARRLSCWGRCC